MVCGEFLEVNKIVFDPRDLIPQTSLGILSRDGSDTKFGIATPINHTFKGFSWQVDMIKAFNFFEIDKRAFTEEEQIYININR